MSISRRGLLLGMTALLAGCSASGGSHRSNYAAIPDEPYPLKAIPFDKIKPDLRRQEVAYDAGYPEGTIVVDTPARRLYYVLGNGRAMRYGIGVGRNGYALRGSARIGRKAEWPTWTPTGNMMRRDPRARRLAGGRLHGTDPGPGDDRRRVSARRNDQPLRCRCGPGGWCRCGALDRDRVEAEPALKTAKDRRPRACPEDLRRQPGMGHSRKRSANREGNRCSGHGPSMTVRAGLIANGTQAWSTTTRPPTLARA